MQKIKNSQEVTKLFKKLNISSDELIEIWMKGLIEYSNLLEGEEILHVLASDNKD